MSPDAGRIVIELDQPSPANGHPYLASLVLADARTLEVVGRASPTDLGGFERLRDAVWVGDEIVASNQTGQRSDATPVPGLVRLTAVGNRLVLSAQRAVPPPEAQFDWYDNLRSLGDGRVAALHEFRDQLSGDHEALVTCAITSLRCSTVLSMS